MKRDTVTDAAVMIVEDDPDIRDSMRQVIEDEGHRVTVADNGRVALDRLENGERPCLILLDLMMPVMNGEQFVRALRERAPLDQIPVVIVSAWPSEAERLLHVVRGYLRKPVDLDRLLDTVHAYCRCAGS